MISGIGLTKPVLGVAEEATRFWAASAAFWTESSATTLLGAKAWDRRLILKCSFFNLGFAFGIPANVPADFTMEGTCIGLSHEHEWVDLTRVIEECTWCMKTRNKGEV